MIGTRLSNRIVRAPRGPVRTCKSWLTEAAYRMAQNNLDPEVAEHPEALVVYGGIGRAARNWECLDKILEVLQRLRRITGRPVLVVATTNGQNGLLNATRTSDCRSAPATSSARPPPYRTAKRPGSLIGCSGSSGSNASCCAGRIVMATWTVSATLSSVSSVSGRSDMELRTLWTYSSSTACSPPAAQ